MFAIIIQEKGGEQRRMVFNKPEVTIGRVQGNDIVLPKGNVSKRHARIVLKDGKFIIVDLKSTNGTYVNGRKITSPLVVKESDKIYIGDFIVGVDESSAGGQELAPEQQPPPPMPVPTPQPDRPPPRQSGGPMGAPMGPMGGPMGPMGGPPMGPGGFAPPPDGDLPPPRTLPPRPAPNPMGPPPGSMGPPAGRENLGGPTQRAEMPPLSPPGEPRTRPPRPAPGGTLPPPIAPMGPGPMVAPIPAPIPPVPQPAPEPAPPPVAAVAAPPAGGAVVPMPNQGNNRPRLVGTGAAQSTPPPATAAVPRTTASRPVAVPMRRGVHVEPLDAKITKLLDLQGGILERLRAKLDLDKIPVERLGDEDLWQKAERAIVDLVETLESSGELPKYIDQETLIKETLNEALGLGPLEDLLADEKIDEIIVDRRDRIVVGKDGNLRGSGKAFSSDDVLRRVVKRLVAPTGVNSDHPMVDVRLRDGSRLTAAISPVAAHGACFVLRKPRDGGVTLADLVGQGALSPGMADFLATCVTARRNVLVCGGAASGKTTMVAALAEAAPPGERVVSVEEVAELSLRHDNWVALETWPGDGKHRPVDMRHLVQSAFRLRPDRLVVGELRGAEAIDLVTALGASLDGAVVGVAGEGAGTALGRVATLARLGNHNLPDNVARELVASAIDIVVHVVRHSDGSIRVHAVDEVLGTGVDGFETQTIFHFHNNAHAAAGITPRFYADLDSRGIRADASIFR
jgi:pilus assembly protein CpaF